MAFNHTGDPNAVDAPSPAPGPGGLPIRSIPADGDPPNAATFVQAMQNPADWEAWLCDKFAATLAYGQATERWRNARLQERFLVDHLGFPTGNIAQYHENWRGLDNQVGAGSAVFSQTQQRYSADVVSGGAGGSIVVGPPDANSMSRYAQLGLGANSGDSSALLGNPCVTFNNSQAIAFDFGITTGPAGVNTQTVSLGLGDGSFVTPISGFLGVMLYRSDGTGTHWFATCGEGTGLATPIDTGIAYSLSTTYRGRIEYVGSGVSDDSTEAIRVYFGLSSPLTLVATLTSHLPSAGATTYGGPFFAMSRTASGSGAPRSASVLPYRLSTNY